MVFADGNYKLCLRTFWGWSPATNCLIINTQPRLKTELDVLMKKVCVYKTDITTINNSSADDNVVFDIEF